MDKIIISEARFNCIIGILDYERDRRQEIIVDAELYIKTINPDLMDDIDNAVDYAMVHDTIESIINGSNYGLIETLADTIAKKILEKFNINKIMIRIKKPAALSHKNVKYAAVEIVREKN